MGNSSSLSIIDKSEDLEIIDAPESGEKKITSEPEFNIDKIHSSNIKDYSPESDEIDYQEYFQNSNLMDQPRFNYIEVFYFAKDIGFPTDFQL